MMEEMEVEEPRPRGSLDFVETTVLGTLVPLESNLDIEEALSRSAEGSDNSADSPLAGIPQRQALFFDETVNVYVVLQTPYFDERSLRSYLGRLVINLEAKVVNSPFENQEGPPGQEVIYNGSVQDSEDPLIVVQGPGEANGDSAEGRILVVWKMSAFLVRPRLRLQNPVLVFSATAKLKSAEGIGNGDLREEYLSTQVPSAINMLEAFRDDAAMDGVKPRLSALRVSRVAPATLAARDAMRPLKNISRQSIKIYPVVNARVKYSRPASTPANPTVLASVDIEITPFAACEVSLKKVDVTLTGGTVIDLNSKIGLRLPLSAFPQDDLTFLYRLEPEELDAMHKSQNGDLEIVIQANANLSKVCQPKISMRWSTSVSFIPPVNPGFGHPTPPIHRPHRPSLLSIGSTETTQNSTAAPLATVRPDALPSMDITTRHQRNPSIPDFGVTMTFTAPNTPIYPGALFTWSVFIVNRSDRPRKLALIVIPRRRRNEVRITRPPSTSHAGLGARKDNSIADAVVDENIVHAMQKNGAMHDTEIVCLSTETRVGPLAPNACYEVELKFMALNIGVIGVEAVRVVDLGTQEHVDIALLPTILVSPLVKMEE